MRSVNDDIATMTRLVKRLEYINVHPYYVYMHDLVSGVEDLRTSLQTAIDLEKAVRGSTAGFNTPTFICDAPGGGGKRDVHSFEHYDRENGISVWTAPSVKPGCAISSTSTRSIRCSAGGAQSAGRSRAPGPMIDEALAQAGGNRRALA